MKATLASVENERVHLHSLTLSISLRDVHVPEVGLADLDSGTGRKGDSLAGRDDLAFPFGHDRGRGHERHGADGRKTIHGIPVRGDQKDRSEQKRVEHRATFRLSDEVKIRPDGRNVKGRLRPFPLPFGKNVPCEP